MTARISSSLHPMLLNISSASVAGRRAQRDDRLVPAAIAKIGHGQTLPRDVASNRDDELVGRRYPRAVHGDDDVSGAQTRMLCRAAGGDSRPAATGADDLGAVAGIGGVEPH